MRTVTYGLVSWLSKASFLGRLFFLKTFRSTLDLTNVTHTRKYQIIFGSCLLTLIKKVSMKNLKLLLILTYVPTTLIESKLQIHLVNPTNPDILKFITRFL